MDDTIKAIADPTRRALIEALRERNDQSLFELCVRLIHGSDIAVSRQAVSKHIAVLEEADLLSVRKVGRTNIHHLDTTRLVDVIDWLTALTTAPTAPPTLPPAPPNPRSNHDPHHHHQRLR